MLQSKLSGEFSQLAASPLPFRGSDLQLRQTARRAGPSFRGAFPASLRFSLPSKPKIAATTISIRVPRRPSTTAPILATPSH